MINKDTETIVATVEKQLENTIYGLDKKTTPFSEGFDNFQLSYMIFCT